MPRPLLIQTTGVCATFEVRIGELNRIVLPIARFADNVCSRRLFVEREIATTRTSKQHLTHGCVKYIVAQIRDAEGGGTDVSPAQPLSPPYANAVLSREGQVLAAVTAREARRWGHCKPMSRVEAIRAGNRSAKAAAPLLFR